MLRMASLAMRACSAYLWVFFFAVGRGRKKGKAERVSGMSTACLPRSWRGCWTARLFPKCPFGGDMCWLGFGPETGWPCLCSGPLSRTGCTCPRLGRHAACGQIQGKSKRSKDKVQGKKRVGVASFDHVTSSDDGTRTSLVLAKWFITDRRQGWQLDVFFEQ